MIPGAQFPGPTITAPTDVVPVGQPFWLPDDTVFSVNDVVLSPVAGRKVSLPRFGWAEGVGVAVTDADGVGVVLAVAVGDGVAVGEADGDGVGDWEGEGEGVTDVVGEGVGVSDAARGAVVTMS